MKITLLLSCCAIFSKSLMKRLQAQPDGMDYDWSVVTTEDEGIEVH